MDPNPANTQHIARPWVHVRSSVHVVDILDACMTSPVPILCTVQMLSDMGLVDEAKQVTETWMAWWIHL